MKVNESGWRWMKMYQGVWRWMKVYEGLWRWMKVYEGIRRGMKVYERVYQWRWMKVYEGLLEGVWRWIKVYEGLWRWLKVYKGVWRLIKVYEGEYQWMNMCGRTWKEVKSIWCEQVCQQVSGLLSKGSEPFLQLTPCQQIETELNLNESIIIHHHLLAPTPYHPLGETLVQEHEGLVLLVSLDPQGQIFQVKMDKASLFYPDPLLQKMSMSQTVQWQGCHWGRPHDVTLGINSSSIRITALSCIFMYFLE